MSDALSTAETFAAQALAIVQMHDTALLSEDGAKDTLWELARYYEAKMARPVEHNA